MNILSSKSMFARAARVVSILALAVSAQVVVAQTIVVQDTFTLNGTTRVAGGILNALSPEIGSGAWTNSSAPQRAVFTSGGAITNQTNSSGTPQNADARIILPTLTDVTTLSVDFTPGPSSGLGTLGLSVGFTASTTASGWPTAGNVNRALLWVSFTSTGAYTVYANGTGTTLASSATAISGFESGNHTVNLTYNPTTSQASVSLSAFGGSSTELYSGSVSSYFMASDIKAAGFRIVAGTVAGTVLVDNFEVTTAIPEPSTVALLMGGLAACGVVMRRRMRG